MAGGASITLLDRPLRTEDEASAGDAGRPPRRDWLNADLVAVLIMAFGVTTLLGGIALAIVATLREPGQVPRVRVSGRTTGTDESQGWSLPSGR